MVLLSVFFFWLLVEKVSLLCTGALNFLMVKLFKTFLFLLAQLHSYYGLRLDTSGYVSGVLTLHHDCLTFRLFKRHRLTNQNSKQPGFHATLETEMFYPWGFWLETKVIIKILTQPCYPKIFDQFSWWWSKKMYGQVKKPSFSNSPILNIFSRKF